MNLPTQLHVIFFFSLKNLPNHGVPFMLAKYSWVWVLPWSVVDIPNVTPLAKPDFSRNNQISVAPWLRLWLQAYLLSFMMQFCLVWACIDLVYAVTVSVSSYSHLPCCVLRTLYPWCHSSHLALTIFLSPFQHRLMSLEGRWVIETFHLGLSIPKSLNLCMLPSCGSLW